MTGVRIPSLDELARALWELESRELTWYELLERTTKDEGIAERATLHRLRSQAHRLGMQLFAERLPAPRPPLGVEWAPVPPAQILDAVRALLPGFELSVYDDSPVSFSTALKVRRRPEMGSVEFTDYVLHTDEQTGGAVVEFVRKMRAEAIRAYGLTAAFEAEWDRARHEAHEQAVKATLALIESTRVWVAPEGDIDDESGYLAPLDPDMAKLKARIEGSLA